MDQNIRGILLEQ